MTSDPQIPLWFEVLGFAIPLAALALAVLALITVVKASGLSTAGRAGWSVVVVVVPVVGPVVWFAVNAFARRRPRRID